VISAVVAAGNRYAVHIRTCRRRRQMVAQTKFVDRFDFRFGRDRRGFQHLLFREVVIHRDHQVNRSSHDGGRPALQSVCRLPNC